MAASSSDDQKEHAAVALKNLCREGSGTPPKANPNVVPIAEAGGIPPLVALARDGTYTQKQYAAVALANLSNCADNKVAIAQAGGILPLVALICDGTDEQKRIAAGALRNLAVNADNEVLIAKAKREAKAVAPPHSTKPR